MNKSIQAGLRFAGLATVFGALLLLVACRASIAATPDDHYRTVWQKVSDSFLFEDRLTNWNTKKAPPRPFSTLAEAEKEIAAMVSGLGDKYTYYMTAPSTSADTKRGQRQNVVSHRLIGNIGYIKIQTFSTEYTSPEVENALQALGSVDGYVLDLRGNGGGLIWQSFRVFAMFQDKGLYKTGKGRWGGQPYQAKYELTATHLRFEEANKISDKLRPKNYVGDKPVVILVDKNTASASESIAGALRFHKKAELVGEKTFGKGITQTTFKLDNSTSLKITYAYTHQPDGNCIHGKGMQPDHVVPAVTGKDAPLDRALIVLNGKIPPNVKVQPNPTPVTPNKTIQPRPSNARPLRRFGR